MSTQHTPGPWWVSAAKDCVWHADHGRICTPPNHAQVWNWESNAHLIAAAPDMYEALRHEAEWHEAQARTHKTLAQRNPGMVYDGLKEAWHRERAAALRAVLAKAEDKS